MIFGFGLSDRVGLPGDLGYIHIFFQCRHTENFIAQREVIQYLLIKSTLSRTDRFQPGRRAIILCSATEFLATVAAE